MRLMAISEQGENVELYDLIAQSCKVLSNPRQVEQQEDVRNGGGDRSGHSLE